MNRLKAELMNNRGLWVYVDSLYSTYLVVQIRLSYDDSIYLVIEIMTYDKEFFMKDKKKEEKCNNDVVSPAM